MHNSGSGEIDRPIDDVFRLTNNHVAEWSIIVVEDEVINEQPGGVGTTFRTVTEQHMERYIFSVVPCLLEEAGWQKGPVSWLYPREGSQTTA